LIRTRQKPTFVALLQVVQRINRAAVGETKFKVQMGATGIAGCPDGANHITFLQPVPHTDMNGSTVSIGGTESAVIHQDKLTIVTAPSSEDHLATGGHMNIGAVRGADIDAGMETPPAVAVFRRYVPLNRPR